MRKRANEWRENPLWISLLYSVLIHLLILFLWRFGVLDLPDRLIQAFVKRKQSIAQQPPPAPPQTAFVPKEIPLTFIEVEPDNQPAPKDAKFYSSANSQAANPDPKKDTAVPKVDGRRENIAKLRDVPRAAPPLPPPPAPTPIPTPPKPAPAVPPPPRPKEPEIALQPPPPAPAPAKEPPREKEPPKPPPGNTETAQAAEPVKTPPAPERREPALQTPPAPPPPPKTRPRTLAEARQQSGLAGEKMKQEGGVRRAGQLSVDAKATPFGEYDAAWIKAVQEQWYNLLDNSSLSPKSGKVVLQFNLKFDGTITDISIRETEVGDPLAILCQRAVLDPSPYPKWPQDMHRMVGGNFRPVTLTFFYY